MKKGPDVDTSMEGISTYPRHELQRAARRLHDALADTWHAIARHHQRIPTNVVIIIGSSKKSTFSGETWSHEGQTASEVSISGDALRGGALVVLEALLHLAAHAYNYALGLKDTSREDRYHNDWFAKGAARVGLASSFSHNGWNETRLNKGTADEYRSEIAALEEALVLWRTTAGTTPAKNRERGWLRCECRCDPPRVIRMSLRTLDNGDVLCGLCWQPFRFLDDLNEPQDRRKKPQDTSPAGAYLSVPDSKKPPFG